MVKLINKIILHKVNRVNRARKIKQQTLIKQFKNIIKNKIEELNKNIQIWNNYVRLNRPFKLTNTYNSIIPLNLYICWHNKDLPPFMKENVDQLIADNPEFNVQLYDDNECREFIEQNFDNSVLYAFDNLIPGAFKADLWRYCMLYVNGGIYLDIKYKCVNGFKLIALTEKEHFVKDYLIDNRIYTALMVTLPKNQILLNCINRIITNVNNKYYGNDALEPTGPALLGSYFNGEEINRFNLYHSHSHIKYKLDEWYIVYNNSIIMKIYNKYREEQTNFQKTQHYYKLWVDRNIYK